MIKDQNFSFKDGVILFGTALVLIIVGSLFRALIEHLTEWFYTLMDGL